jgi:hypothetical protein
MDSTRSARNTILESPDTEFWRLCRQRGCDLNIPAWMLAEEGFRHEQRALRKPASGDA